MVSALIRIMLLAYYFMVHRLGTFLLKLAATCSSSLDNHKASKFTVCTIGFTVGMVEGGRGGIKKVEGCYLLILHKDFSKTLAFIVCVCSFCVPGDKMLISLNTTNTITVS